MDYIVKSYYWESTETTAFAASLPFPPLAFACFTLRHVIMPLPIGFLLLTDRFIIAWVEALEIKSKWGVSPLITQPNAINASYFLIFFEIVIGISKTPGTLIIFSEKSFKLLFAFFNNDDEISS